VSRSDDERIADILDAASQITDVVAVGRQVREADLIGLRTVLAHHYHRVDPNQVWIIATKDIPALLAWLSGPQPSASGTRLGRDPASNALCLRTGSAGAGDPSWSAGLWSGVAGG
jgi:hypothetical protein